MTKTSLLRAMVVLAVLIPPARAMAQQDDAEWMKDCRRNGADGWERRETYCETRTATARPSGDVVSMEGLRNGGVAVTGWDRRINKDVSTDLGSGGATIRATTTNGPLTLRRK